MIKKKYEKLFCLQANRGMNESVFSASLIDRYGKQKKLLVILFLTYTDKNDATILLKSLGYQIIAMGLFSDSDIIEF